MKVMRIHPNAKLPSKADKYAAGWDFFTPEDISLPAGKLTLIPLGVKISFAPSTVLILMEKSGIASRTDLILKAGVVDSNYRGEVKALYYNAGKEEFKFSAGEKVVQGLLVPLAGDCIVETDELDYTERNENGFGSTGRF